MQAQDRVYEMLLALSAARREVTAAELANELHLSRQVVSHYLTRLLEQGLAEKTNTRPVYWKPVKKEVQTEPAKEDRPAQKAPAPDVFSAFIGADGSQAQAVEKCRAAVSYPPDGLPLLLTGKSGVGKSFLARLIWQYAVAKHILPEDAPFVVLNCADYANNPELLSAALLGYKKGSFTGAASDKDGLLTQADGGFLFLDEIHRLSFENQEKLFVFMDTGRYRPLGSNAWRYARVRLLFATTEAVDTVLLETFRRRIAVRVHLKSMLERPFSERLQMVALFYRQEAEKVGKRISVSPEVLEILCFSELEGNAGMLRNTILLSLANAYAAQKDSNTLCISLRDLPEGAFAVKRRFSVKKPLPPLLISPGDEVPAIKQQEKPELLREWQEFFRMVCAKAPKEWSGAKKEMLFVFEKLCQRTKKQAHAEGIEEESYETARFFSCVAPVLSRYGIRSSQDTETLLAMFFRMFSGKAKAEALPVEGVLQAAPKAAYVAARLLEATVELAEGGCFLQLAYTFLFLKALERDTVFHGLIVAHGNSTASSLQAVANQTCGTFVFESIDMPMDTSVEDTILKVNAYLEKVDTSKGVILLVDMGSLNQMYRSIKNNLGGNLLIINNVTTAIALDIGMKILYRTPFWEIAEEAKEKYIVSIQYFEGLAKGSHMIVSCMSGVGISEKICEMLTDALGNSGMDVITMEYKQLKELMEQNKEEYFQNTKCILATSNMPGKNRMPWVNIYDVLEGPGEQRLWRCLSPFLSREQFEALMRQFVRFFSIEGITSKLAFLNPNVVINEVEAVILRYEARYGIEITGRVKLNLSTHIAFMIERLMTAEGEEEAAHAVPEEEEAFYQVSRELFQEIEKKYHVVVNRYELSLLYELFRYVMEE